MTTHPFHDMTRRPRCAWVLRFSALALASSTMRAASVGPAAAASFSILASDAGFVTELGGSAKGDATVLSTGGAPKYNC